MNNFIKIFTLVICFATFFTSTTYAQRFGFLNSQNLLAEYPEVKNADKQLQTYQEQLSKQYEGKAKALEAKFAQYVADMQAGKIPATQAQATEASLQKERSDMMALEQKLAADVSPEDSIFVYAKAQSGPPMPLAAKRLQVRDLPFTLVLNDDMAMMP